MCVLAQFSLITKLVAENILQNDIDIRIDEIYYYWKSFTN